MISAKKTIIQGKRTESNEACCFRSRLWWHLTVVAFDRDMNEVREQAVLIWGERAFRQKEQQVQRP